MLTGKAPESPHFLKILVDLPQIQGLTQQDREFTPTESPISMGLKMFSAAREPDGPDCLTQQSVKLWKTLRLGLSTFNVLKDVMVCALRCCAESNLRKAPCSAMVGMLDGIILYMGGAVKTQED